MCGSVRNVNYPAKVQLNGNDLPWVETGSHIGHELHQMCNMDFDVKTNGAKFINTSSDIFDGFSFAHPDQVLRAISLYCGHGYRLMLWDLSSKAAGRFFRYWNIPVKIAWRVPRCTHTYLVKHLLAVNHSSLREQLLVSCQRYRVYNREDPASH